MSNIGGIDDAMADHKINSMHSPQNCLQAMCDSTPLLKKAKEITLTIIIVSSCTKKWSAPRK